MTSPGALADGPRDAESAPPGDGAWPVRLERAKPALACPGCGGELAFGDDGAACTACSGRYPLRRGKLLFTEPAATADELDTLKHRLKHRLGRLYYSVGVGLLAPTFPFDFGAAVRRRCEPARSLCVDVGCGNRRVDADLLTVDLFDYDEVDIVCDLTALPFKPASVDAFVSRSALEHVSRLDRVAAQLARCTRSGGYGVHLIPFMFPYHASPHDYQRLTHSGAARLFEGWEVVEQRGVTGPVTLLLLWVIEFLSSLASAGNERVKPWLYLGLCALLFPFKFLDAPFVGRRSFLGMAPTILTTVRKP